jgi:hypothetical protein
MVVQKIDNYSMGGRTGEEILDPEIYKALYDRVRTEVERRKAQGRGG